MDATILDYIIFGSLGLNVLLGVFFLLVKKYSWDVTRTYIRAGISGVNTVVWRWTTTRKWKMDIPQIDPKNANSLDIMIDGMPKPREITQGSFGVGPDKVDVCITTDKASSTINMDTIDNKAVGGTPDFVADQIDLAYTRGYKKGFDKTVGTDWMSWVSQNWVPLIIFVLMFGIALTQFSDKVYTGPQGWQAAKDCEVSKQVIVAKCAPFVDVFGKNPQPQSTPTSLPTGITPSATGAQVT
jgi:hypothetical protein